MQEYVFALTRTLPCKDRIYDSVLIRENTGQRKPVFLNILCSVVVGRQYIFNLLCPQSQPLYFTLSLKVGERKIFSKAFHQIFPRTLEIFLFDIISRNYYLCRRRLKVIFKKLVLSYVLGCKYRKF